jgi:hypothetical protein
LPDAAFFAAAVFLHVVDSGSGLRLRNGLVQLVLLRRLLLRLLLFIVILLIIGVLQMSRFRVAVRLSSVLYSSRTHAQRCQ